MLVFSAQTKGKMPKCPNCQKEVYFGEISTFFISSAAFHVLLMYTSWFPAWRGKQELQSQACSMQIFAVFLEGKSAQMGETRVAAHPAYLNVPGNTNVHVCDTSEPVLT